MNNTATVQFLLSCNKRAIRQLEEGIEEYRAQKTYGDIEEEIEIEYKAHSALKILRKELKKHVESQKMLKKLLKV